MDSGRIGCRQKIEYKNSEYLQEGNMNENHVIGRFSRILSPVMCERLLATSFVSAVKGLKMMIVLIKMDKCGGFEQEEKGFFKND